MEMSGAIISICVFLYGLIFMITLVCSLDEYEPYEEFAQALIWPLYLIKATLIGILVFLRELLKELLEILTTWK